MPDDVHKITIEVPRPRGGDPGAVEEGYYCVADQHVVLTDANGRPISGAPKHYLDPGGDARFACVLLRQLRRGRTSASKSFNRPLNYGRDWRGV